MQSLWNKRESLMVYHVIKKSCNAYLALLNIQYTGHIGRKSVGTNTRVTFLSLWRQDVLFAYTNILVNTVLLWEATTDTTHREAPVVYQYHDMQKEFGVWDRLRQVGAQGLSLCYMPTHLWGEIKSRQDTVSVIDQQQLAKTKAPTIPATIHSVNDFQSHLPWGTNPPCDWWPSWFLSAITFFILHVSCETSYARSHR